MRDLILEACVENVDQAIEAERKGAHRIELCSRLDLDGLTPPIHDIRSVLQKLSIPVKVMIRPRPGNFIYSSMEIETMIQEIEKVKSLGVGEVVLGVLNDHHKIQKKQLLKLAQAAAPLPITFHKAIDLCSDPIQQLLEIQSIHNVQSVLTSGKAETALMGAQYIKQMIKSLPHLSIISAGKITSQNITQLHTLIGGTEYHGKRIVA